MFGGLTWENLGELSTDPLSRYNKDERIDQQRFYNLKMMLKFYLAKLPSRLSISQATQMLSMSDWRTHVLVIARAQLWPPVQLSDALASTADRVHPSLALSVSIFLISWFCCPIWLQENSSVAKVCTCQFLSFRLALSHPFFFSVMTRVLHWYVVHHLCSVNVSPICQEQQF